MSISCRNALRLVAASAIAAVIVQPSRMPAAPGGASFAWPAGTRAAVSFSFDDARDSQLEVGLPLFAEMRVRATFYLTANAVEARSPEWRAAAAAGHELANHSLTHPCSGNFEWARARALEDYTLERMKGELVEANAVIARATGVTPATFAYPCGQTFVGRGARTASYVPLVSELFVAGRGWLGEGPNDPSFVDLAQVVGHPMDEVTFAQLRPAVDDAIARGRWLVLAGHDIGEGPGRQVTRAAMLRDLVVYLREPSKGVWVDTVGAVAAHVRRVRE